MLKKKLRPEQIITLSDYPVHNDQILKIYFRVFQSGCSRIIPPCPVIHKSIGTPVIKGHSKKILKYNKTLKTFLEKHPEAEYFLLDGSHKTTAAALTHKLIPVFVFESDKDIKYAKNLVEKGEIFSLTTGSTMRQLVEELKGHFFKTLHFQTVAEKTERMVKNKILPRYMIDTYRRHLSGNST
jgi:hypothetical protein